MSNQQAAILVVGQSNGVFSVYNLDNLQPVHSFQIAENRIDSVCLNASAEWIALGSKEHGQLFVWEWKSETYVMKQ
jgi:periodic tryptophan protein 2